MRRTIFIAKVAIGAMALMFMSIHSKAQFTLQLFHASDLEGGVEAIGRAPHFAAIIDTLEEAYPNTLIVSAGDNWLSGPFYSSADGWGLRTPIRQVYDSLYGPIPGNNLREGAGRVDVSIMNIIGFHASALGNHEFDLGTNAIEGIIAPEVRGGTDVRWLGNQFPYLSANLDFSADNNLSGVYEANIVDHTNFQFDFNNKTKKTKSIAPATIVTVNGEKIGIVGATTPLLERISSPGNTKVKSPGVGVNDMSALATHIQPHIDNMINNMGVNKVILVSHLQQYQLEEALAPLLSGIDVIVSGGSDGLFANPGQRLHPGHKAVRPYPVMLKNKDNDPVAVVSTDGQYSYVGHLVLEFDNNGKVKPNSINPLVSRPYPTDSIMVDSLWAFNYNKAFQGKRKGALVKILTDAVSGIVQAKDGNIVGKSDVYIDGRRTTVRTQEANMGNLSADANLWQAQQHDASVMVSMKNGGGIRAAIGDVKEVAPGKYEYTVNKANALSGKKEGEVSQLDLENTMKFNNKLTIVPLKPSGIQAIFEHGVSAWAPGATPGQMPQIGGAKFSFDPSKTAGSRIQSFVLVNDKGDVVDTVIRGGKLYGDTNRIIKLVTLNFLAGGGDGYPFKALTQGKMVQMDTLSLAAGNFTFASAGSEQDAMAEYMNLKYSSTPFDQEETPMSEDERIQIIGKRADGIFPVELEFAKTLIEEMESTKKITLELNYNNKTISDATVNLVINKLSTATNNSDFLLSNTSFIALAGKSGTFTIDVNVTDDKDAEQDEYLIVEVDPAQNHLLKAGYAIVYLNDNDRKAPEASKAIELKVIQSYDGLNKNGNSTEIVTYDKDSKRLYVANSANAKLEILDFSDPKNITEYKSVDVSAHGEINSVAVKNGIVACAMEGAKVDDAGKIALYDTDGKFIKAVNVGVLPDMVTITHDGKKAIVACEGEPNDDYDIDPEGSVAIVDLSNGAANATAKVLDFNSFDSKIDQLRKDGVRIFGNYGKSSVSQDLEPEYVTISPDNKTAWVACQENNALVIVDLTTESITDIKALGTKDYSVAANSLDCNRKHDKIHLANYPVKGFYHPDAIASYVVNGTPYVVTANEGDAREYDGYAEEIRLRKKDIDLDPTAFPNEQLVFDLIGDVKTTTANGDTDGDGDLDEIFMYGARSFSIFNGNTGALVYDSENQIEQISWNEYPTLFNTSGAKTNVKNRSDDKGPEPEAVVIGALSDKVYAFVGAERSGGVYVFDITDPTKVEYTHHHNNRDTATGKGDIGPEGMVFIPNAESPNKLDLLVVANEVSSTLTIYHVYDPKLETSTKEFVANEALKVFPNPTQGNVTVASNEVIEWVEVVSLQGSVIAKVSGNGTSELKIDLNELNGQFFVLKIATPSAILSRPVVRK